MAYIEIETGDDSTAYISTDKIRAVISGGNVIDIKYEDDSLRLTFTSRESTTKADNRRKSAYVKIIKSLEKE